MITDIINTSELFVALDKTWANFFKLVAEANWQTINTIPFKDGWSIAQVATHVKKSNKAIIQGLQMKGKPCERNPDERIGELKKVFLDFKAKYKSPDFILPEKKEYKKEETIEQLKISIEQLKELRSTTNLSEIISLPIFGEITKLEILHFVLYHTQRHVRQLKNIYAELQKK